MLDAILNYYILYLNAIVVTHFMHGKSTGTNVLTSYRQFSIPALLPRTDHSKNRPTTSYYYVRSSSEKMDFSKHIANLMQFTLKRLILIFKIAVLWLLNYALQVLTISSITHWLNPKALKCLFEHILSIICDLICYGPLQFIYGSWFVGVNSWTGYFCFWKCELGHKAPKVLWSEYIICPPQPKNNIWKTWIGRSNIRFWVARAAKVIKTLNLASYVTE